MFIVHCSMVICHFNASLAELKRQILARIGAAADGDHDILLAVDHIGHGGSALRSGHPDGANLLAGLLVIGSQHCATGSSRGCRDLRVTHHNRSEEHTSELQSHSDLVCRLLLEKKKYNQ